jgi:hypothetical protein
VIFRGNRLFCGGLGGGSGVWRGHFVGALRERDRVSGDDVDDRARGALLQEGRVVAARRSD